jgi:hypothetical protein
MADREVVSGEKYHALANDMSDLIIKHTTLGPLGLDEALSIIMAVTTDYARDAFEDPTDALCSIVRDRMTRPMPDRLPIGPTGAA